MMGPAAMSIRFFQSFGGDGSEMAGMFRRRDLLVVGVCSSLLSYFLLYPVMYIANPYYMFGYGSAFTFCMYFVLDHILMDNPQYSAIPTKEKRFYVLSNIIKAAVLMSLSFSCGAEIFRIVFFDEWEDTFVKNCGAVYSMTDFVSLLLVRRMQWTTIAHHVLVVVFNFWSMNNDYSQENICRAIVVYAVFSSFAYLVNFLLASRFLEIGFRRALFLSLTAFLVYATCCMINWTWQLFYLSHLWITNPDVVSRGWIVLFSFLILFVVWDDVVLLTWLLHNSRKMYGRIENQNLETEKNVHPEISSKTLKQKNL